MPTVARSFLTRLTTYQVSQSGKVTRCYAAKSFVLFAQICPVLHPSFNRSDDVILAHTVFIKYFIFTILLVLCFNKKKVSLNPLCFISNFGYY